MLSPHTAAHPPGPAGLKSLRTALSTEELTAGVAQLKETNAKKQTRLAAITSSGVVVTPGARQALVAQLTRMRKAWKDRKTLTMEVVEMVSDGLGKKAPELMVRAARRARPRAASEWRLTSRPLRALQEELGVESDANAGVDIKDMVA